MPDDQTLNPNQSAVPSDAAAPVIPDPQQLVDEALGSPLKPSAPSDAPAPVTPEITPPTPDPVSTPADVPAPEEKAPSVPPELLPQPEAATAPASEPTPAATPSPSSMTDDIPLAFASAIPADMPKASSDPLPTSPLPTPAPLSPLPTAGGTTPPPKAAKKKGKAGKMLAVVAGFFLLVSSLWGGWWYYKHYLEEHPTIAGVKDNDKDSCNGCYNGGWLKWRNGRCVHTGICDNTKNPDKNTENPNAGTTLNSKASCEGAGKGYVWCSSVDSTGKAYAFCNTKGKGCNQAAIEEGYTILIGAVKCKCTQAQAGGGCGAWAGDHAAIDYYWDNPGTTDPAKLNAEKAAVDGQCQKQMTAGGFTGTGGQLAYVCKLGVKGAGGVVYSGGACTNLNGKPFTGNLGCFCGTVQIDTPTGHQSYSSQCGCEEDKPSPTPSPSGKAPILMCTSLKKDATPLEVGKKITFTCEGASNPAGAVTLNYQYRIMKDGGAWQTLTTNAQKKAEYTIPADGAYKVQCRACGNVAALAKNICDPDWTGATQ